ncbi:uncharacterized protein LOC119674108 [Teleopsis dalmanni]|uniref:uncharacterized protein LOC119674108 n=1 Tax=Teleopsis dalmanni TaxID=139649 RepID=UPI0018CD76E6|nr:uncharacterized protein LOC119674108 [Teleopsis dalmanni]
MLKFKNKSIIKICFPKAQQKMLKRAKCCLSYCVRYQNILNSKPLRDTYYFQLPLEIMNIPKIVIVGAGPSGIACATKLLDYGFHNVIIVEAEKRIGGRIHTIPFADNVIDLGAQWCHGEKDNIVYELAYKHNLLESTGDVYESYECIRSNREVVPESISQRLKDIVNDSLVTRQMELRNCSGSLGSYITNKFYEALRRPENSDIDIAIAKEFFENYQKFENSVEASDTLDEVSGRGYLEYWECDGDILLNWKDKGYIEFLNLLMKSKDLGTEHGLLDKRIILEKRVKQIYWNRNDSCVDVKCEDGENFLADHVILTVSLGVLKDQHLSLFEPKLPVEKQRAIDGLAFGTVNKIFIEFPVQFWPNNWTGFTLLWREEDIDEIRGTARAWLEDVFGFYCVNYQPKILSGWIIGVNGRHMETLPEEEVLAGCMYLFRKFLTWNIPDPVNFKTSTWYTNENFRGSYSFRSMFTEEIGTSARELAQPLTVVVTNPRLQNDSDNNDETISAQSRCDKPIIQFAGEATSDHYYSTVHGAVEAGWREARRLAQFYGKLKHISKNYKSKCFDFITKIVGKPKSPKEYKPRSNEPRIVIVGAGISGIACALRLLDYGFEDIILLEAQSRIGGRIHTVPFADNVVDLGAQWCHGEINNIVFQTLKAKKRYDLLDTTGGIYVSYECIRSNGQKVDIDITNRLKNIVSTIIEERKKDIAFHTGSLALYLTEKFNEALALPENNDIDETIASEFWENFKKLESTETSTDLDEVSACGFNEYYECPGDYMLNWRDKGYTTFLRLLLQSEELNKELGRLSGKVVFNTIVSTIRWNTEEQDNMIEICIEGSINSYKADHVVVTVSLGVLKANFMEMFEPPLPDEKKRAINGLGFGSVGKIFLEFPEQFWPDDWTGFSTLWREEELAKMRGTKNFWLADVFGFYCVNYQPRILVVWTVGKLVMFIESLPRIEVQDNLMFLLRQFLPNWDIPKPKNILIANWESNRFFRGSYSFRSLHTEFLKTTAHALSLPLTVLTYADVDEFYERASLRPLSIRPVVLFAGEATSKHYYSTVHGAMESGYREADRLAGYYSKPRLI